MPPPPIFDPRSVDCSKLVTTAPQLREMLPQRYEFELLDGICHYDRSIPLAIGYYDVRPDAWWTRGHIPGRPLMPGVMMIEVAAQLSTYLFLAAQKESRFIGFAGADDCKFRGTVSPPARFIMGAKGLEVRTRRVICACQAFVDHTMVFEGTITGMLV